jgi:hypothetical protein
MGDFIHMFLTLCRSQVLGFGETRIGLCGFLDTGTTIPGFFIVPGVFQGAVRPMIAGFLFTNYLKWIFFGDALTTITPVVEILLFAPETLPSESDTGKAIEDRGDWRRDTTRIE